MGFEYIARASLSSLCLLSLTAPTMAAAQTFHITGRVVEAEGHETPQCRRVQIVPNGSTTPVYYRIPNTGSENGILAVALTALTSGLSVRLTYQDGVTTGCGPEPRIAYLTLLAG